MISYAEAINLMDSLSLPMENERIPLADCIHRTLAEDLIAPIPSPCFTNSAMDGFALIHNEIAEYGPLKVSETRMAGSTAPLQDDKSPSLVRRPGTCMRIMTGSIVPTWADTIVPFENCTIGNIKTIEGSSDQVTVHTLPLKGSYIRHLGEDIPIGATLLKAGTTLLPEQVMVAAAFGFRELKVIKRPKLHLWTTGNELIDVGQVLPEGFVFNSSRYFLLAAAKDIGLVDVQSQTMDDDPEKFRLHVQNLLNQDTPTILITTGAVSAGDADFIPQIAKDLGFRTLFHQVAIRPGKPVFLAQKGRLVWLGLPGNPISTVTTWHFFARPLLARLAKTPPIEERPLVLKNEVKKPEHLRCFYRAEVTGKHTWVARRQGSGHLAASLNNQAYVILPEGVGRILPGTPVNALIL